MSRTIKRPARRTPANFRGPAAWRFADWAAI